MKRFYKNVTVTPVQPGLYEARLDGKPIKTPEKNILTVPSETLAQQLADEWLAQGKIIVPSTMPLTQLVSTCIDKVSNQRDVLTKQLLKFIDTDLLFYRADHPPEFGVAQAKAWDPLIKEAEGLLQSSFETTDSLVALKQPEAAHANIKQAIAALNDYEFTVLQVVAPFAGSFLVAYLFVQQKLDANEVMDAIRVEERLKDKIYDAEKYGADPALEKADAALMLDLVAAEKMLLAAK